MFRSNRRYRHKSCLDIDIRVTKITWIGPDYWRMQAYYINRWGNYIICPDNLKIRKDHFHLWKEVVEALLLS